MRPHRLELVAIGSYASEVVLDFDALAPFGLFHIHGPTGAGKSSLLDGLCFALYGKVPPPRDAAHLRSHHAAATVEAKATFDFSLQGNDYRIVRTPAQSRAKKVGTGTTHQLAKAVLHRRIGDRFEPIASAVKEVDALIEELIGLDHEQFMQVVVLPQGGFQEALRANAKDRGELLSSLFHAERFGAYGDRLKERAAALTQRLNDRTAKAELIIGRVKGLATEHQFDIAWPDDVRLDSAELEALALTAKMAAARVADIAKELEGAEIARTSAAKAHSDGARLHERQVRHARAANELAELASRSDELDNARQRLKAAADVQGLVPLVQAHEESTRQLNEVRGKTTSQQEAIDLTLDRLSIIAPGQANTEAKEVADTLIEASTLVSSVRKLNREVAERRASASTLEAQEVAAAEGIRELAGQLEQLKTEAQECSSLVANLARHTEELEALRAQEVAADRAAKLEEQLQSLRSAEAEAATHARSLSDAHLALWQQRLEGMAGELAQKLTPGDACAVCGAVEHPSPAAPSATSVSESDVTQARHLAAEAEQKALSLRDEIEGLNKQLQQQLSTAGSAGEDRNRHRQRVTDVTASLSAATAAQRKLGEIEVAQQGLQRSHESATSRLEAARKESAENAALLGQAQMSSDETGNRLLELLGEGADAQAASLLAQPLRSALDEITRWSIELKATERHLEDGSKRLTQALAKAGCTSVEDVKSGSLDEATFQRLSDLVDQAEERRVTAESTLKETDDVAGLEMVNLDALALATTETAARYDFVVQQRTSAELLASECESSLRTISRTFDEVAPLRVETERVRQLAEMCASGKNEKKMSLKNFVLAAYLEEVAAAASVRLKTMSSGRYELHHSDKLVKGGASSGLSLVVSDAYTGQEREVNSLSGGETFMASLALALGLADVVQSHAGGVHVEALFIDEGFGSLDADTLELAMAELDRLREGGRLVGVISHVPTLRERIPAGVEVVPGSNGSTIRMRNAGPEAA